MSGPGWRQQEELEQRRWDEDQELLKADAEAYEKWLDEIIREGLRALIRPEYL